MPIDHKNIRVLAIALIKHQGKFLACAGFDKVKKQSHYRLLGGGVDFTESAIKALHREIKEELGANIAAAKLLGIEENIFNFNGRPGHEIIYLYAVKLKSKKYYLQKTWPILDSKGQALAEWISVKDLNGVKVYPPVAKKYL
ncbi:NUDIX domain-containing protein [Patescibacteria group bacterium]|nr:NUDIX domain-containing protein [Patescibacteria group bacterium]